MNDPKTFTLCLALCFSHCRHSNAWEFSSRTMLPLSRKRIITRCTAALLFPWKDSRELNSIFTFESTALNNEKSLECQDWSDNSINNEVLFYLRLWVDSSSWRWLCWQQHIIDLLIASLVASCGVMWSIYGSVSGTSLTLMLVERKLIKIIELKLFLRFLLLPPVPLY